LPLNYPCLNLKYLCGAEKDENNQIIGYSAGAALKKVKSLMNKFETL